MPKKQKIYLVLSQEKDYLHGAFPYSEEGKENAEKYIRKMKRQKKN